MQFPVGKSSYPDLRGQMQYVATAEIASQVASLCYEFDTQVAKGGDRLTVNEGIRSRDRQLKLYNDMLYRGGALAARPYTSTHDASRGSALDFGITRPDGSNRALTPAEFDWLHKRAPQRGIRWTGASFARVEPWHHNGGYSAALAPIPNVNLPGEPIKVGAPDATPIDKTPVGDIVNTFIIRVDNGRGAWNAFLANPETMRILPLGGTALKFWRDRNVPEQPGIQAPQVLANFEVVKGKGA